MELLVDALQAEAGDKERGLLQGCNKDVLADGVKYCLLTLLVGCPCFKAESLVHVSAHCKENIWRVS